MLHTANVTLMACNKETQTKHIAKSLSLGILVKETKVVSG